jgi:hypothetical protein
MFPPPKAAQPQKPPIVWTIAPLTGVAYQMWADGSVKVQFQAEYAEEVLKHFESLVSIMKQGAHMIKNPPKTCPSCRGKGQVVVKNGAARENVVCPECKGSGKKITVLPEPALPVNPALLMTRNVGHVTPLPKPILPHQNEVPDHIKPPVEEEESDFQEMTTEQIHQFD